LHKLPASKVINHGIFFCTIGKLLSYRYKVMLYIQGNLVEKDSVSFAEDERNVTKTLEFVL